MFFNRTKANVIESSDGAAQIKDQAHLAALAAQKSAGYGAMNQLLIEDLAQRSLELQGKIAARALPVGKAISDLSEVEFKVFSQWGEDGIIEWLISHLPGIEKRFVEFGVETFRESSCRFLLHNRNWKGLVLDGSEANIRTLKSADYFWKHDLTAKAAFVTAENINNLLQEASFVGNLGILAIDVDGNDYWIWKAITAVSPAIVVCEVNPIFGDTTSITVPYKADFSRFEAHYSGLYFGASIKSLQHLADQKGYAFVGTGLSGVNAFFVRSDLASPILDLVSTCRAYPSKHQDSRDLEGNFTYINGRARAAIIADCLVIDPTTGKLMRFGDVTQPFSNEWLDQIG